MGVPFSDITLYLPTPHEVGTEKYNEDAALKNYVCDWYVQNMDGYKPPKATRITVQPAYHNIWKSPGRIGSIVHIAPYFSYEEYSAFDKQGKYKYILDLIQGATIPLSEEYGWDKTVFEKAYKKVLESKFKFRIETVPKRSRDRKKAANLIVEKTETITSLYVNVETGQSSIFKKLFDKENKWFHDSIYRIIKKGKWFDTDRFGIEYEKKVVYYSLSKDKILFFKSGKPMSKIKF